MGWPYMIANIDCGTSFECSGPEQKFNFGETEHQDVQITKGNNNMLLSVTRNGDSDDNKEWTLELKTASQACYQQSQACSADWRRAYCNA